MEPAGSQGVWSLDDYQFVSFIWGAAQMVGHARVKPKSIADYEIADILAPDYHFFGCIKVIITFARVTFLVLIRKGALHSRWYNLIVIIVTEFLFLL